MDDVRDMRTQEVEPIPKDVSNCDESAVEIPKGEKSFLEWIKAHKKQLILAGVSIPATTAAVICGVKKRETLMVLRDYLAKKLKEAQLYSPKWFETVSDEVLASEREKVRLDYCSSGDNFDKASALQNLLWRFDKELSKRAWGGEEPRGPSFHREHGWHLLNDD